MYSGLYQIHLTMMQLQLLLSNQRLSREERQIRRRENFDRFLEALRDPTRTPIFDEDEFREVEDSSSESEVELEDITNSLSFHNEALDRMREIEILRNLDEQRLAGILPGGRRRRVPSPMPFDIPPLPPSVERALNLPPDELRARLQRRNGVRNANIGNQQSAGQNENGNQEDNTQNNENSNPSQVRGNRNRNGRRNAQVTQTGRNEFGNQRRNTQGNGNGNERRNAGANGNRNDRRNALGNGNGNNGRNIRGNGRGNERRNGQANNNRNARRYARTNENDRNIGEPI